MATQIKHRRGTNAEIMAGTPAIGELWFNTDDNTIHMGDGITLGGIKHAKLQSVVLFSGSISHALNRTDLVIGFTVEVKGATGVSTRWDVVDSGSVTPNGETVYTSIKTPGVSLVQQPVDVLVFDSVSNMINRTTFNGTKIDFYVGQPLKVFDEADGYTNYIVVSSQTNVSLGNGLWAKAIASTESVSSSVVIGDANNFFDDNEIIDSVYGAFVKAGITMTNIGSIPQSLTGAGTADATPSEIMDYSKDWIYYAKVTANAAGVSSIRLGGSGDALGDVIEISFNYNHVTSLPEVGTISINFFNLLTRVLYTGTQFADFAIVYDSKYDVFYMLDRGQYSFYSEIADRAEFANVSGKTISKLAYVNDASGSLTLDHSKLCKPNYIAVGDSLCGGDNYFAPDPVKGWSDYDHQWENHANAEGINTVIINRGIGGQRSDAISARIQADVIDQGARQCYMHLSTNDARDIQDGPLSYTQRSFNVQTGLNLLDVSGVQTILINSVYSNLNAEWASYYQNYLTDTNGFRTLSKYKTWVDQMLVLADPQTGVLDPQYTDPDGTHLNQVGYTLMGNTIGAAAFSPVETVNRINDETKFDFPGGLQSQGKDVNINPTGWAVLEPVTGSFDYKVSVFTEGADSVVLGGRRYSAYPHLIHVILSDVHAVAPVLSTYGPDSPSDAGIATYSNGTAIANNPGARDITYFCQMFFVNNVEGLAIPDETVMQRLSWLVKF